MSDDWQPIDTAPKDGKWQAPFILLAWDAEDDPDPTVERLWHVDVGYWDEGWAGGIDDPGYGPTWMSATSGDMLKPTHWQPMIAPPTAASPSGTSLRSEPPPPPPSPQRS